MKCLFLLTALALISPAALIPQSARCADYSEERVVIFDSDHQAERKTITRWLGKQIRAGLDGFKDYSPSFRSTILGSPFHIGTGADLGELDPVRIHSDVHKLYAAPDTPGGASETWSHLNVIGEFYLPLSLSIPVGGPLSVGLSASAGSKYRYDLTVRSGEGFGAAEKLIPLTTKKLIKAWKSAIAMRIPLEPKTLLRQYSSGTEIYGVGDHFFLVGANLTAGLNSGLSDNALTAGATIGASLLVHGQFERRVEILEIGGKKGVRLSYRNLKGTASSASANVGVNVTLFQHIYPVSNGFNVLAAGIDHLAENSVFYDYTFDPSIPAAEAALRSALRGDLRPAQALAIDRWDESRYQGIIINQEMTDGIDRIVTSLRLGPSVGPTWLFAAGPFRAPKRRFSGGFLAFQNRSTTEDRETDSSDYYRETDVVKTFDYTNQKTAIVLFGLFQKDALVEVTTSVVKADVFSKETGEHARTHSAELLKLYYRHSDTHGTSKAAESLETIIAPTARLFSLFNADLARSISAQADRSACLNSKVSTTTEVTFYENALVAAMKPDPASFPDLLADFEKQFPSPPSEFEFKRKFFKPWQKIRATTEPAKRAEMLRNLFKSWGNDSFPLRFIAYLSNLGGSKGEGLYVRYLLNGRSPDCRFTALQAPSDESIAGFKTAAPPR